jgi:hypothetical protein
VEKPGLQKRIVVASGLIFSNLFMELDCYHSSASVLAALSSIAECRVKEVKASVEGGKGY